jgi:hypothetical protein
MHSISSAALCHYNQRRTDKTIRLVRESYLPELVAGISEIDLREILLGVHEWVERL